MASLKQLLQPCVPSVLLSALAMVALTSVLGCRQKQQPAGTDSKTPAPVESKKESGAIEEPQTELQKHAPPKSSTRSDTGTAAEPSADAEREAIARLKSIGVEVARIDIDAWIRETSLREKPDLQGVMAGGSDLVILLDRPEHFAKERAIADRVWLHLKQLNSLKGLHVLVGISDAGLGQIKTLGNLETLFVMPNEITDAGLALLKELTKLRMLFLVCSSQITDAGLEHLGAIKTLESLTLFGNLRITNDVV